MSNASRKANFDPERSMAQCPLRYCDTCKSSPFVTITLSRDRGAQHRRAPTHD